MKLLETKDFGKISHRYTHRSKEWMALARAIFDAENKLQMVIDSLDTEEVEKFHKVITGKAYCAAFGVVISHVQIEGSNRRSVVFNDAYVPEFVTGKLQSIPVIDADDVIRNPTETVELNEWQVKRGYCHHLARVNLIAAVENLQKRKFSAAMGHLCQALMQIGAASARDPVEIEKLFESKKKSDKGRANANARHNKPNGSRQRAEKMRLEWATGKYDSRDRCAEEMCSEFGMSLSTARKALRNTPDPI